ncbi:glycine cleavage system aminomethyltransferase GcvT [bacterium]|nr:glycine cleavage system aminomethyltransferase GcvT [bacterium]
MADTPLKSTALTAVHKALGARMVPFAGYEMPVSYAGLIEEHKAVRSRAGVFDVSHMGEFEVEGPGALDFLQYVTSNDVSKLFDGKVQYSCLPNGQGGIVDDLLVYRRSSDRYWLVVNASNMEKDWNWLQRHAVRFDVHMRDISEATSLLAVQGPEVATLLQGLCSVDLGAMEYYTFVETEFAGIPNALLSTTGYTGAGGVEIYVPNEHAEGLWKRLMELGIPPVGLGARDTLRLEMGFCLYGNDIDDTTSPLEAGLGWITKFSKDFVDRERLERQKSEGVQRKLVGFELLERGIPRQHYTIYDASGNAIGEVTSGTQSPSLDKAIGMGYVHTAFSKPDSEIWIGIRDKKLKARVMALPFYKK